MKKDNLLYFKASKINKKNFNTLKNFFLIKKINKTSDLKKIKNKIKIKIIYCDQKNVYDSFFLKNFPNLKFLVSPSTSTEFIDHNFCKKKKIKIISLENEKFFLRKITPTAEHILGLILVISRNYFPAIKSVYDGSFDRRPFGGYKMLSKCNLGIIGYGRIGKILKKMSKNIFKRIYTADINNNANFKKNLIKIFKNSDFISLNIPSQNNKNFFSKKNLPNFYKSFYLINTSRGDVIDEKFVLGQLKKKNILGYATDVIKGEFDKSFNLKNSKFFRNMNKYNILITPHIGGSTKDAWFETEKRVIEKLLSSNKKYKLKKNNIKKIYV